MGKEKIKDRNSPGEIRLVVCYTESSFRTGEISSNKEVRNLHINQGMRYCKSTCNTLPAESSCITDLVNIMSRFSSG